MILIKKKEGNIIIEKNSYEPFGKEFNQENES
jgi:hypothetical protein